MNYVQCKVERNQCVEISWLPEKFAVTGRLIDLKKNGQWEKGWTVKETYGTLTEEAVMSNRDNYKYHRQNTDI